MSGLTIFLICSSTMGKTVEDPAQVAVGKAEYIVNRDDPGPMSGVTIFLICSSTMGKTVKDPALVTGSDWTVCTFISLQTYEDIHASLVGQISQVDERMRELESSSNYSNISSAVKLITSLGSMWKKLTTLLRQDLDEYLQRINTLKHTAIQNEARPTRGLKCGQQCWKISLWVQYRKRCKSTFIQNPGT